jgi:hypothetical protein
MEASEAGLGGAENGQQAESGQQSPAIDLSPIQQHTEELVRGLGDQMTKGLEQLQESLTQQDEGEDDYGDLAALLGLEEDGAQDPGQQQDAAPDRQALQQFVDGITQRAEQRVMERVEQTLGPMMEHLGELQMSDISRQLEEQIPELKDEAVAERVLDAAAEWAQSIGQPALALHPTVIKDAWTRLQAQEQAAGGAGGELDTTLESAGGARPGTPDMGVQQGIVEAGNKNRFWTG